MKERISLFFLVLNLSKWGGKPMPRKTADAFLEAYPGSELATITPENFETFLL